MSLIDILADLVAYPSVSGAVDPTNQCMTYAEKHLVEAGLVVNRHESNNVSSIVATSRPTKNPKVLLQAHLDVVPAEEPLFQLRQTAGKLYGRGVYDMKFAAACYLQLAADLKGQLEQYDFGIMLTGDEEIGGLDGVKMLLNKGYGAEMCILPDGGDNWNVETEANGLWILRLIAKGKSAHGSRPWEGDCAIDRLLAAVTDVKMLFGAPEPDKSSLTISQIEGGKAVNQVADSAEATLDMRFISTEDCRVKRASMENIARSHKLRIETVAECANTQTDMNNPRLLDFLEVAGRVRGKPIGHTRSLGGSDARYFCEKSIPTVLIRPEGGGAHSSNEWIDETELVKFYEVIKTFIVEKTKVS